eukprot:TRINITY_DN91818_c0_g1_i1.p1 TRINITY_DN91818_c0_g1~~TRINITY_DN91818_c0_g1_i1.p1  ORF type:complete len:691 (-),score=161.06 TRINITY_DN91818_c0_g1_i1:35-2107(-)
MLSPDDACCDQRAPRYLGAAWQKRREVLGRQADVEQYYNGLVAASRKRADAASLKDRKQIQKDLPRTFHALPPLNSTEKEEALKPMLLRILTAYIERGRCLCAMSRAHGLALQNSAAATTARGILTGYPQGLNFLAGMGLLAVGAAHCDNASRKAELEEAAFWLLALLLEDVLDPDFFGADVRGNLKMDNIGGLGMRSLILEKAERYCPCIFSALGKETFTSCLGALLDSWVLSLFIGCAPHRLLEHLWDHLLLPSPYHPVELNSRHLPRGLAVIIAFGLAALQCCGEEQLRQSQMLARLTALRERGVGAEEIALEAGELIITTRNSLLQWPAEEDTNFLNAVTRILVELAQDLPEFNRLWDEVRKQKQRIADCAGNLDEQLMSLARQTHFSVEEIERLRVEVMQMPGSKSLGQDTRLDLASFEQVVKSAVPEFPCELCGRLFQKLDCFGVGRLTFVELACGMSALSLGTMDEKLQVCFDLFDSEGRRALTLKDLNDLCATLFRVALAQGFQAARKASTDDALNQMALSRRLSVSQRNQSSAREYIDLPLTPPLTPPSKSKSLSVGSYAPERRSRDVNLRRSAPVQQPAVHMDLENEQLPWRSMLLRLLAAAKVRTPGGPWLVAFDDFRNAAHMEPALLCLFAWCLPRPPEISGFTPRSTMTQGTSQQDCFVSRLCGRLCHWFGRPSATS